MTVRRSAARMFRTVADAVRSVVAPAALVRSTAPAVVADPEGTYTADEMPEVEVIEAAAAEYVKAGDARRAADRLKRKSSKVLDRLPAGLHGRWLVERVESSRTTVDLEQVRATYKRLGLGEVPMRQCSPSLRLTDTALVVLPAPVAPVAAEYGAALVAA
ncbi:hypothetical protein AB0O22_12720 [Streptomyces sp. NPDC091204]|uniref:hypothetical protein n=1 Tax=Streptomyces sp. NPDC091204 TaxID=3155299 RepID=UPI003413673B